MLWIALHLPRLPLESFPSLPAPSAIIRHERIVVGDAAASAAGVSPGMRLAAAWGLLPTLTVQERDPAREAAALERLACRAGSFTSEVCIVAPQCLLLEVAASLRLFGGPEALLEAVLLTCREEGLSVDAAIAPTPLAAEWLARGRPGHVCRDADQLRDAIGPLGMDTLALPPRDAARLTAFGTRNLAELLQLPRAGLARRLGTGPVMQLARALGEIPDPRPRFAFPSHFAQRLELPGRVEHAQALSFAGRRLVAALCGWLAQRQAGVLRCRFALEHEGGQRARPATVLEIGFTGATRDPVRIHQVLDEHLHHLRLPAGVEALTLSADAPLPLAGESTSLFGTRGGTASTAAQQQAISGLIERLQARLGAAQVHGLCTRGDHRPEQASQACSLPAAKTQVTHSQRHRPLWLLPEPQAVREQQGRPHRGGPLQLVAGPERIESGWWDTGESSGGRPASGDVRRDYFVARSKRGEWLWVFRSAEGWFVHGFFA